MVYSASNPTPSYGSDPYLVAIADKTADRHVVAAGTLDPGSYWFRVQAIRSTHTGWFVVAQSEMGTFTIP